MVNHGESWWGPANLCACQGHGMLPGSKGGMECMCPNIATESSAFFLVKCFSNIFCVRSLFWSPLPFYASHGFQKDLFLHYTL